ncbi:LuxR C-terminal-related transcriptional regulator [Kitasatospora purpeofusca]|uniref:LuxR C-terminal-related transcriptional regulator n=1 Tax=Kitasatospora purpeofusca TaxID=67352 RepID=UPI00369CF226
MPYTRAAPAPLAPAGPAAPPVLPPAAAPASPVPTAGADAPAGPPAPARLPNGDPMLATRVRPPHPPAAAFLHRDRLLGRLDAAALRPVTLVNGPAGAGKTLLVADWLARGRLPGPAGWLTLEPSDNQPGTFWAYVREALQTGVAGLPAEVGAPARAEHVEPSLLLRLAAWINARPRPTVLVLDECEHLDNLRLAEQLHDLVRHTDGRLRLVLVGRSEPLLPLHRYRAAGELAEIRAGELALNRAETAAVLERHGLRVGPAAVGAVHHALSGWTAGVRLLALAAQEADDPEAYLGRIDAGPTALSDFLLAEVLRTQPAPTQDLLLRCSLLGRVHPDLADALTGRRDGRRILDRLHQDNAFTDALPDGWYRLHPMFAGILRLHLRAAAPERVDELRVRAAHWLAGHGQYRAALDHAAEAGAWALAARLLVDEFALGELLAGRDATRLCALFARMPPTEHSPAAELVRAAVHLTRDEAASALTILEHVEPLLPADRTALQLAAVLVRTGAARLLGSAPLADRAARRAGELEHRVPADLPERHPELLTLMAADLGSTLLWHGRLDEACRALERAARAPVSPTTARLRHDALCRLALVDHLRGWPGRAERRVRQADEEADRSSLPPESRTEVRDLVLAATALERDEPAEAGAALHRTTGGRAPDHDPVVTLGTGVVRAGLLLAQGRPDSALRLLDETRRHGLADRTSDWSRERLAVTACAAHLAAGRPAAAVAALDDVPLRAPDSLVVAARARLAAGRDEQDTLAGLRALRDDPAVGSATRTRALLLLAQAAAEHDGPDSARLLAEALAAAEPERLRRPFRESAPWVRRRLRALPHLARAHGWLPADLRPPARDPAPERRPDAGTAAGPTARAATGPSARTTAKAATWTTAEPLPAAGAPVEPLTGREREILLCAARLLSTQEIADELYVSPNTVKTHLKSVNRKLRTANRRDAVRTATRLRLLDAP